MRLFVDTANLEELEQCLQRGFPTGVTTNPSILSKEQRRDFRLHINDMIALLRRHDCDIPLSVEVFTTDPREMIAQAEEFVCHFGFYFTRVSISKYLLAGTSWRSSPNSAKTHLQTLLETLMPGLSRAAAESLQRF